MGCRTHNKKVEHIYDAENTTTKIGHIYRAENTHTKKNQTLLSCWKKKKFGHFYIVENPKPKNWTLLHFRKRKTGKSNIFTLSPGKIIISQLSFPKQTPISKINRLTLQPLPINKF